MEIKKRSPSYMDELSMSDLPQAIPPVQPELLAFDCDSPGYRFMKRFFDLFLSLLALAILWPFMLIIMLIIYIDDPGGSPIFVQTRVGKDGKQFRFYKFRSMIVNAEDKLEEIQCYNEMDGPAFKMIADPRVTKFGHVIRRTSIDELPQLLNIIKGNMSIVGPRPPLPREVALYGPYERQRLLVKPGLTCYWQVSGRSNIGFREWMEMDVDYVFNHNLKIDMCLILRTIIVVIRGDGAM